jgi:AcrR family transcriptional regulator
VGSAARQRILDTACDLFYRQGYQATGVNQLIADSGVAKATFYANFPSKEDLGVAYLRTHAERELAAMREAMRAKRTPLDRYLAVLTDFEGWFKRTNFRGCAFANMATEVVDTGSALRREVLRHDDAFRQIIREAVDQLQRSAPRYRGLDAVRVAEAYYVIARGAIIGCQLYRDLGLLRRAVDAARTLVNAG